MLLPPRPGNESERLADLLSYDVLDTEAEQCYDDLTRIAAEICGTPIALVSLVDTDRQWFKSRVGLDVPETPRDLAFCAHAILGTGLFIVKDTHKDERFADHPLVLQDPKIRFYAGIPLISAQGYGLGTLCVIDRKPKDLDAGQREALSALGRQVIALLELRLRTKTLEQMNTLRTRLLAMLSHDLKNSFNVIGGFSRKLIKRIDKLDKSEITQSIERIATASQAAHQRLEDILDWSSHQLDARESALKRIDLSNISESVVARMNDVAEEKNIRLQLRSPDQAIVIGDECLVISGIQNMLSNAIKFSYPNSSIEIAIKETQNDYEFSVTDHGTGLEPQLAEAVFSTEQLHSRTGTLGETGTGIGTLLIGDFVSSCNGTLKVNTAPGKGCSLSVTMPKAKQ